MRCLSLPLVLLLATGAGSHLKAQDFHCGVALNLILPTGGFRSTTYGPTPSLPVYQEEGYDLGLGGQFTLSFPVDPKLAIRLNVGGHAVDGTNTAPGYDTINLRHSLFSLGGDLQIFTQSAYRHRGTYFLAGLAADFERFDRSFDDISQPWADLDTTRKSRLGGNLGIGHTFGGNAGVRFNLEATFHTTLNGNDEAKGEPPSTNFVRLSLGFVF